MATDSSSSAAFVSSAIHDLTSSAYKDALSVLRPELCGANYKAAAITAFTLTRNMAEWSHRKSNQ